MEQFALQYGYAGLFLFSFIASTLVAAPADVMAMAMPQFGYNPWLVGLVASVGGYLGNLVNYGIGKYGATFLLTRFFQRREPTDSADSDEVKETDRWLERAEQLYDRYGVWSLLFSGTPFIGDPLTTVAGAFRVNLWVFTVLVLLGKFAKFALLLGATDAVVQFF